MNMFGFRLSPSAAIDLDKVDTEMFERLCAVEPDAIRCMACGSCSATCMASDYSGMSVRKMLLALQRGKEAEAFRMMKACMLCGKCTMVCPRGLNTRHIILAVSRIWSEKEGRV